VYTAAYVDAARIGHVAVLHDGTRVNIDPPGETRVLEAAEPLPLPAPWPEGATRRAPLGCVAGARSGDKGGVANVGVWARTDEAWRWLAFTLTVDRFRALLPETAEHPITRHVFPKLRALNFVVDGLLGEGVAASTRFDPQGKALGEWLRARCLDIPEALLQMQRCTTASP
jgi:hypothetical protein